MAAPRRARREPAAYAGAGAFKGHAIEVRLYAEDAYAGFLPQTGRIDVWRPATGPGVRIDHGMKDGLAISPFYDPMIAKVIARAPRARRRGGG